MIKTVSYRVEGLGKERSVNSVFLNDSKVNLLVINSVVVLSMLKSRYQMLIDFSRGTTIF